MRNIFSLITIVLLHYASHAQSLYFPPNGSDTWDTLAPAELQWCDSTINNLYSYLGNNQSKAFILLKDGKIVLEQYFNGHSPAATWYWASAGKTLTALVVGIAQQEGLLHLSDTTSHYLGEGWTSCTPEQEQAITIRHQLTMTSGLNDAVSDPYCTLDTCLVYEADAGSRWAYHNAPYTLLDSVIEVATSQSLNAYCFQHVLQPTGMQGLFFPIDYNNVFLSNARSMARFGLLLLSEGSWNSTPVLNDANYFYQMTHTSQNINEAYGYLTWLNGTSTFMLPASQVVFPGMYAPSAPADMFAAIGRDGQFICIVPSQNLVWIRMGENPDQLDVPLQMIEQVWQYINALPCTSSALDTQAKLALNFFPNPTQLELKWQSTQTLSHIQILNTTGETVMNQSVQGSTALNISALSSGLYVCQWSDVNGQTGSSTFIKE